MRLALKIQTTSWKPSLPVLLLLVAGACGGPGAVSLQEEALEATGQGQALNTMNSLSVNGLSVNGLSVNGLSVNGLSVNGLNTSDFVGWFDSAPDTHDQVMRYLIRCAVSEGEVRTYTSPTTGLTRSWQGGLGLAPSWASGVPATVVEQQVVSACLAAHVNTYGYSVPISISGLKANGAPLPFSWQERLEYGVREACFFGNLFNGEGIYAGNDQVSLAGSLSSSRACGLSHVLSGQDPACPPILRVGAGSGLPAHPPRGSLRAGRLPTAPDGAVLHPVHAQRRHLPPAHHPPAQRGCLCLRRWRLSGQRELRHGHVAGQLWPGLWRVPPVTAARACYRGLGPPPAHW
jgi:hypothetical protein